MSQPKSSRSVFFYTALLFFPPQQSSLTLVTVLSLYLPSHGASLSRRQSLPLSPATRRRPPHRRWIRSPTSFLSRRWFSRGGGRRAVRGVADGERRAKAGSSVSRRHRSPPPCITGRAVVAAQRRSRRPGSAAALRRRWWARRRRRRPGRTTTLPISSSLSPLIAIHLADVTSGSSTTSPPPGLAKGRKGNTCVGSGVHKLQP